MGVPRPVTFTSSPLPPYDRGRELGTALAGPVGRTAAAYRDLFAATAGGPFDVDLWATRAWATIRDAAPAHAEEIQGIADGAGLPVEAVAAVNARTELLVAACPTGVRGATECSSVVCLPEGRTPFGVQTWDWYHALSDGWFHWRIPLPDGRTVETVTEFGMLAKIGVNGYGVGVMLNMLHHRSDATAVAEAATTDRVGHPVHLLSRRVLEEARSVEDAWRLVQEPTSASTSLTVLDRAGGAASLELFPDGPDRFGPDHGVLTRTNHFLSAAGRPGCLGPSLSDSTVIREDKLEKAFATGPADDAAAVVAVMTDHEEGVGGICRHPDPEVEPALRTRTLATVVLDLDGSRLDVRPDGPCGHRDA